MPPLATITPIGVAAGKPPAPAGSSYNADGSISGNFATPTPASLNAELEGAKQTLLGLQTKIGGGTPPVTPAQPTTPAANPTNIVSAEDQVAQKLGYGSYADAEKALTGTPSKSETDLYNDAYSAAGLDALSNKITSRQNDLNGATGNINDNPWLDEASRVGRVKNLTTLATGDIKNWQDQYNTGLKSVHDLVTREVADNTNTSKMNATKLASLEAQAKIIAAENIASANAATKAAAAPPKTIKGGATGATYQWNTTTQQFDPILPGPTKKAATPSASASKSASRDDVSSAASELSSATGGDGYVSPQDWQKMLTAWTGAGYSSASFITNFKNYANPYDSYVGLTKKTSQ